MAASSISLFPDTNLFIQCNELRQLDWSSLGSYEHIDLVVARPIQKEIDKQKGGSNARLSRRARKTASLFGEIIQQQLAPLIIRESNPRVTLRLGHRLKPDPSLELDYADADDALVGIAHGFAKANPELQVALLTQDTGVQASAVFTQTLHFRIPDAWLLQPEETKAEKDLRAAQAELSRLRSATPNILAECIDGDGQPVRTIEVEFGRIKPLTDSQIDDLARFAKDKFPLQTFGRAYVASPHVQSLGMEVRRLAGELPSQSQISEYSEAYSVWVGELREALKKIHLLCRQERGLPVIRFRGENRGSRPAENVLVEMVANGHFGVGRHEPLEPAQLEKEIERTLPPPPAAPSGGLIGRLAGFHNLLSARGRDFDLPSLVAGRRDDPDAFYFKGDYQAPVERLVREAGRWRHGVEPRMFPCVIQPMQDDSASGSVEFCIHASNMTEPFKLVVPIKIRAVELDAVTQVAAFIQKLKPKPVA